MTDLRNTDTLSGKAPVHGGRRDDAARRYRIPKEELLDFSASINPLGPPAGVAAAVRGAALEISHYPEEDAAGLAEQMAAYLDVPACRVVPGNGSIEVLYWLVRALKPARVLVVEPTFSEYRRACVPAGAACDSFKLREEEDFALDVRRIRPAGHDLVFLCNPNNPTGYLVPADEVVWLWRQCRAAGAGLVVDEAFIDFAGEGASVLTGDAAEGIFVVRSFTKSHALAGLRLGCLVAREDFALSLREMMPPWNINVFARAAGRAALADTAYLLEARRVNFRSRFRLFRALASLPGIDPLPSEANFILCRLATAGSDELADCLGRMGIMVRDCRSFPELGNRFIRVAVRSDQENYQLISALKKALA
ncbi:MAG: threonine-phosphate decarboxylase [Thermoleophilia bacterium]|nr:threonine-phosphate decarboxylase [Thermoleophilia bacterium]